MFKNALFTSKNYWGLGQREPERELFHSLVHFPTDEREEAEAQKQKLAVDLPHQSAEAQTLGPAAMAFPSTLAGSGIKWNLVGMGTNEEEAGIAGGGPSCLPPVQVLGGDTLQTQFGIAVQAENAP